MQKAACNLCGRVLDQFGRIFPPKSPDGYLTPFLAVDNLILKRNEDGVNKIVLVTRRREPFKGLYALPGGHVDVGEELEAACLRELKEETNLVGKNPRLFGVYGKPDRDPRKHVISAVYHVEVEDSELPGIQGGDDAASAELVDVEKVMSSPEKLAFDHYSIISDFLKSQEKI